MMLFMRDRTPRDQRTHGAKPLDFLFFRRRTQYEHPLWRDNFKCMGDVRVPGPCATTHTSIRSRRYLCRGSVARDVRSNIDGVVVLRRNSAFNGVDNSVKWDFAMQLSVHMTLRVSELLAGQYKPPLSPAPPFVSAFH